MFWVFFRNLFKLFARIRCFSFTCTLECLSCCIFGFSQFRNILCPPMDSFFASMVWFGWHWGVACSRQVRIQDVCYALRLIRVAKFCYCSSFYLPKQSLRIQFSSVPPLRLPYIYFFLSYGRTRGRTAFALFFRRAAIIYLWSKNIKITLVYNIYIYLYTSVLITWFWCVLSPANYSVTLGLSFYRLWPSSSSLVPRICTTYRSTAFQLYVT